MNTEMLLGLLATIGVVIVAVVLVVFRGIVAGRQPVGASNTNSEAKVSVELFKWMKISIFIKHSANTKNNAEEPKPSNSDQSSAKDDDNAEEPKPSNSDQPSAKDDNTPPA